MLTKEIPKGYNTVAFTKDSVTPGNVPIWDISIMSTMRLHWSKKFAEHYPLKQIKLGRVTFFEAIIRQFRHSYPLGISPKQDRYCIYTNYLKIQSKYGFKGSRKTMYNYLKFFAELGIMTHEFHGRQSDIQVWIPAWILLKSEIPDNFFKKENVPQSSFLSPDEKNLPISQDTQNPNSIKEAVKKLATLQVDTSPASTPLPHEELQNQEPRTLEPKVDREFNDGNPTTTKSIYQIISQNFSNLELKNPEPKDLEHQNRRTISLNENEPEGGELKNLEQGAPQGAGLRMKKKRDGNATPSTSDLREKLKRLAWIYCQLFWKEARNVLYDGKVYNSDTEAKILAAIWVSVFKAGIPEGVATENQLTSFLNRQIFKIQMVRQRISNGGWVVHDPAVYFDVNNTKCGFVNMEAAYQRADARYREVAAFRLLKRAKEVITSQKRPKGHSYKTIPEQYQYWRKRMEQWGVRSALSNFDEFYKNYCLSLKAGEPFYDLSAIKHILEETGKNKSKLHNKKHSNPHL